MKRFRLHSEENYLSLHRVSRWIRPYLVEYVNHRLLLKIYADLSALLMWDVHLLSPKRNKNNSVSPLNFVVLDECFFIVFL